MNLDTKLAWRLTRLRRHAEALAAIAGLTHAQPDDREVMYLQAVNLRAEGRLAEALSVLDRLQTLHPRYSRLFEERGHCLFAARDLPNALAAFLQAVRINPALPDSWDMLVRLHRAGGDEAAAVAAAEQRTLLDQLPPDMVRASGLFSDGDLLPAENIIRAYLRENGNNLGGMRLLARIGMERNALEEAQALLEAVLTQAPDFHAARLDYATVLLRQQQYEQSRQEAQALLRSDPGNREFLKLYGAACVGIGDYEPVIALYAALLTGMPPAGAEVSALHLWRGNALKTTGRYPEAVADYQAAVVARPDSGVAWFSLANLKTYEFAAAEVACMRSLECRPGTAPLDRCYLCFALGKALEDAGDYPASWQYYERGNALKRAAVNYRPELAEICARQQMQECTAAFFAARAGWGAPDAAPIFIVGLPRSGSTLIEQILASHSQVEGTQELTEMNRLATELGRTPRDAPALQPDALRRLTAGEVRRLADRFLSATRIYRRMGRPFFIDKMPNNFWHIGLIHLMLPKATIIDARREPMSCGFSNLKQLYGGTGQAYSYDMEHLGRYYRTYLELMRHWNTVLPGRVLTVQHEDLVADLEGSVRRILDHCRLPFEQACLEFHATRRDVHTASSEQVRRPIFRDALLQWRHYEQWLGPLRSALGDALAGYRN